MHLAPEELAARAGWNLPRYLSQSLSSAFRSSKVGFLSLACDLVVLLLKFYRRFRVDFLDIILSICGDGLSPFLLAETAFDLIEP